MGALELVCNLESKEKNNDLAENILYDCLSNGLSFKVSQGNVLTLTPPLIITEEELKSAIKVLENSFEKLIGQDLPIINIFLILIKKFDGTVDLFS
jgi:4-aminobutyrate aminotransferase